MQEIFDAAIRGVHIIGFFSILTLVSSLAAYSMMKRKLRDSGLTEEDIKHRSELAVVGVIGVLGVIMIIVISK